MADDESAQPDDGGRVFQMPGRTMWEVEVRGIAVGFAADEAGALERLAHQRQVDLWWAAQDPLAERPAGTPAPRPPAPADGSWELATGV